MSAKDRAREKYTAYLRRTGRPVRVPLDQAQSHLRRLHYHYGMSCERLSELCSLSAGSISEIIRGERRNAEKAKLYQMAELYRVNAESVLAIQPEPPKNRGGTLVDATGTTRRVQGLAAIGFPIQWVGEQCGFSSRTFYRIGWGQRKLVYFSTAHKIRCLYEKLELEDPVAHGISSSRAKMSRTYAERNGYILPIYWDWDTIDDPQSFPDYTGQCGTANGVYAHRRLEILPICQPCRDAYNAVNNERRKAKRAELADA